LPSPPDAPTIPDRGSYALPDLKHGPAFGAVVLDLLSVRFRHLVEQKFDMDLSKCPPCIVMMGNTTDHYNEGYSHNDSKRKIVAVLLGFSREWPYERGRMRVLRSNDRDDCAFEFAPEFGRMLMFRVSEKSWHGFLPQKGQRMRAMLRRLRLVREARVLATQHQRLRQVGPGSVFGPARRERHGADAGRSQRLDASRQNVASRRCWPPVMVSARMVREVRGGPTGG
jgi:hypothetical protein